MHFYQNGRIVVYCSSFLVWLELEEIGKSIKDILLPTLAIITSPYYFFEGYYQKAKEYLSREYMVYIGSGILAIIAIYILDKITRPYLEPFILKIYEWLKKLHDNDNDDDDDDNDNNNDDAELVRKHLEKFTKSRRTGKIIFD